MKTILICIFLLINSKEVNSQNTKVDSSATAESYKKIKMRMQANAGNISANYIKTTDEADLLFDKKEYKNACELYKNAFKSNNDQAKVKHRYNMACCLSLLNEKDSAFVQLYRIAQKGGYSNINKIESDPMLFVLHTDSKWLSLLTIIRNTAKVRNEEAIKSMENN